MLKLLIIISVSTYIFFGLVVEPAQKNAKSLGARATFEKLNLKSCSIHKCIELQSEKATQGNFNQAIAFKDAIVRVVTKDSGNSEEKFIGSGFYDTELERIYFTDVQNSKFKEAYYDKLSGKLIKM